MKSLREQVRDQILVQNYINGILIGGITSPDASKISELKFEEDICFSPTCKKKTLFLAVVWLANINASVYICLNCQTIYQKTKEMRFLLLPKRIQIKSKEKSGEDQDQKETFALLGSLTPEQISLIEDFLNGSRNSRK